MAGVNTVRHVGKGLALILVVVAVTPSSVAILGTKIEGILDAAVAYVPGVPCTTCGYTQGTFSSTAATFTIDPSKTAYPAPIGNPVSYTCALTGSRVGNEAADVYAFIIVNCSNPVYLLGDDPPTTIDMFFPSGVRVTAPGINVVRWGPGTADIGPSVSGGATASTQPANCDGTHAFGPAVSGVYFTGSFHLTCVLG